MKHPVPAQGERRKSSWCQAVQGLKTGAPGGSWGTE